MTAKKADVVVLPTALAAARQRWTGRWERTFEDGREPQVFKITSVFFNDVEHVMRATIRGFAIIDIIELERLAADGRLRYLGR